MNYRNWFREAGYGMMVHFGLYSLLAGEYKGRRTPNIGEWAQSYFAIPNTEYERLASVFHPLYFDAEEWIALAADAGMRYFVITAKHHDGFALFHSRADRYNVVDATPFGRDIIEELANACARRNMKFGLYYSQELDWHEKDGGGYNRTDPCAGSAWTNAWDWPEASEKNFARCFEKKIKPQVKEILTQYGELCLIWFDTPCVISQAQSRELYDMVKQYQPHCLINSRLGNGAYDYCSLGDNEIPPARPERLPETLSEKDWNDLSGFKYSPYGLYETAATLNDTWGFKYFDQNWKSAETIAQNRRHLNKMGVNYLLNVGPDGLGRIPSFSASLLREAGALYERMEGAEQTKK